jgi:hypothetical protein
VTLTAVAQHMKTRMVLQETELVKAGSP